MKKNENLLLIFGISSFFIFFIHTFNKIFNLMDFYSEKAHITFFILFLIFSLAIYFFYNFKISFILLLFLITFHILFLNIKYFENVELHLGMILTSVSVLKEKLFSYFKINRDNVLDLLKDFFLIFSLVIFAQIFLIFTFTLFGFEVYEKKVYIEKVKALPDYLKILVLIAPISEEIFFRGLLNFFVGPIVSSIIFGAAHFSYGSFFHIIAATLIGLIFAFYVKVKNNLIVPLTVHILINILALVSIEGI